MHVYTRLLFTLLIFLSAEIGFTDDVRWQGRALQDYIESLEQQGLRIIYSSDLVQDDFEVREEPVSTDPRTALTDVVGAYGLTLREGPGGSILIVRPENVPAAVASSRPVIDPAVSDPPLPEVIVTSSLHRLQYQQTSTHTFLDRETTSQMPDLGDEAIRITDRLPGTASGGVSTRNHVRGGEANEVLFLLDGLRLYEPYHMKDFQSIATIVNSGAIAGIDYYSGGFPAIYGDRMSGVMDISLREPTGKTETELALSVFNASLLSIGSFGHQDRGDWLISARRGNLDLVFDLLEQQEGSPRYQDYLLHLGWDFSALAKVSMNLLVSSDEIAVSRADEESIAEYDNRVGWVRVDSEWSDSLFSQTVLSASFIDNERTGQSDLPAIVSGSIDDKRFFRALSLKQDWKYNLSGTWVLGGGFDFKLLDADYRYQSAVMVQPPFDTILDNEPVQSTAIDVSPGGSQSALYVNARWQASEKITLDAGLRWDQQTYTTADDDDQVSPRFGLLYRAGPATEFRFGWGQFHQAQEINELQVSDGLTNFFPAQRADHIVANLSHTFRSGLDLQIAIYHKTFQSLRPRFENLFNPHVLIPELQLDRARIDANSARARGAEITLAGGTSDQTFTWWANYAWSEVEDSVATGHVKRSWDQTHALKAGLTWSWRKWIFSAAGIVHTGWPMSELVVDPTGSVPPGALSVSRNNGRYSTFHSIDARVSRTFAVSRGELMTFFEVANLYNRENPCCIEYKLLSSGDGSLEIESKQGFWLPLIPSLGIVWRF